jgi:hypothetical protein
LIAIAGPRPTKQKRASHIVLDKQGSYRVGEDGSESSRLNSGGSVASKCGPGACLRAQGREKATFIEVDIGESSAMKFVRTPSACEVIPDLLSVDTLKWDFMSIREIRETRQQQNFRFWAHYPTVSAAFGHDE